MLVAVVSTAGVLALWLLPIILGCGALSIATYCGLADEPEHCSLLFPSYCQLAINGRARLTVARP